MAQCQKKPRRFQRGLMRGVRVVAGTAADSRNGSAGIPWRSCRSDRVRALCRAASTPHRRATAAPQPRHVPWIANLCAPYAIEEPADLAVYLAVVLSRAVPRSIEKGRCTVNNKLILSRQRVAEVVIDRLLTLAAMRSNRQCSRRCAPASPLACRTVGDDQRG